MLNILAAVALAVTFSSCTATITVEVELKDGIGKACEICSACLLDPEFDDPAIDSDPTFGQPSWCVTECVECYCWCDTYIIESESTSLTVDVVEE